MTTKRKLMVGIASLGVLVILAGLALGLALAALTGNVTSGFTISYTAFNVSAGISGSWGYNEYLMKSMTSNGEYKILFDGTETSGATKNFDPIGNIELTAKNPSVIFKYNIFNFDEKDLPLSFKFSGDMENLDINYSIKSYYFSDFDEPSISEQSGLIEKLPFSANGIVPQEIRLRIIGGYDGLYQNLLETSDLDEMTLPILQILFAQGEEAAVQALNAYYTSLGGTVGDEGYQQFGSYLILGAALNAYRIFLETDSYEQAYKHIDKLNITELWKDFIDDGELYEVEYKEFLKGVTSQYIYIHYLSQGRYVDALEPSLRYLIEEMDTWAEYYTPNDYASLVYYDMCYNILNTYINEGYDAANKFVDELYERSYLLFLSLYDDNYFDDISHFEENYNEVKQSLTELHETGFSDDASAEELRDQSKNYIDNATIKGNSLFYVSIMNQLSVALAQDDILNLIAQTPFYNHTEITVTISLKNDVEDAYLNSGNFEFVLGQ